MMDNHILNEGADFTEELDRVRELLRSKYPDTSRVLGAQLGEVVRNQLRNPDIKGRFGGLKSFLSQHFPDEVIWRGKRGLDDEYEICLGGSQSETAWQPVLEGSASLWTLVTNPSTSLQLAWEPSGERLLRGRAEAELPPGAVALARISRDDYKDIARAFVGEMDHASSSRYLESVNSSASSFEFTELIRQDGLLTKWEPFRVEHAIGLFASRLRQAGASDEAVEVWVRHLRESQSQARVQRSHLQSPTSRLTQQPVSSVPLPSRPKTPTIGQVAAKTMEYMSDSAISELRLPLGSVMEAIRFLMRAD